MTAFLNPPARTVPEPCTCRSTAAGGPCKALWHDRDDPPAETGRNRHERRKAAREQRSRLTAGIASVRRS